MAVRSSDADADILYLAADKLGRMETGSHLLVFPLTISLPASASFLDSIPILYMAYMVQYLHYLFSHCCLSLSAEAT